MRQIWHDGSVRLASPNAIDFHGSVYTSCEHQKRRSQLHSSNTWCFFAFAGIKLLFSRSDKVANFPTADATNLKLEVCHSYQYCRKIQAGKNRCRHQLVCNVTAIATTSGISSMPEFQNSPIVFGNRFRAKRDNTRTIK